MFGFGVGSFQKLMSKADGKVEADKRDDKLLQKETIFALDSEDGATIVELGGSVDAIVVGNEFANQKAKIEEYRNISRHPDVARGVDEVVNDAVSCEEHEEVVSLILDDCDDISEKTKELIRDEFDHILRMLDFKNKAFHLFKRWYIDGRIYAHTVLSEGSLVKGIQKVVMLDARCTRLVEKRQYESSVDGIERIVKRERVFVYNPSNVSSNRNHRTKVQQGIEVPEDSVVYAYAHEYDAEGNQVGHLDDVIKPANDLRNMEDAVVIYRIVNAPERRVYYIDTGNLPKKSAEELVNRVKNRFRNKVVYDSASGKVKSETKHMAMTDAIWLPRREGSNATEVDTIQGGQNLGEMDDVKYFRTILQESMKVPQGRRSEESMINIGGGDEELTREELKFAMLITRYRREFNELLYGLLKRQLILKRITTKKDWDILIQPFVKLDYAAESAIKQQYETQKLLDRFGSLNEIEPYVGSLISRKTVMTKVLRMTEEEMADEEKQIEKEKAAGLYPESDEDSFDEATGLKNRGTMSLAAKFGGGR